MRGVLARASGGDRPVRHRPAHAIPSPGRTKRIRIRGHDGARHARVSIETRRPLTELRQWVTRLPRAPRIAHLAVTVVAAHASMRRLGVRPVRTRALRVALFICVISTGFISAAPSLTPGDGPPLRASSVTHRPPPQIASGPTASRLSASEHRPMGAAPETVTTPSVGRLHKDRPADQQGGLSLDMQSTPPAPDDPDLEHALSDLDKQADLDQLMSQQRGLGDQPPQSTPSTTAAPNAKPSGTHGGQPATSRWVLFRVAESHREGATREEI